MFIAKKKNQLDLVKADVAVKTTVYVCPGYEGEVQVKQGTLIHPIFHT